MTRWMERLVEGFKRRRALRRLTRAIQALEVLLG